MKLHEALEQVNEFYAPGVVRYYAQLTPDPWMQAHEDLERVAGIFDETIVSPAADRFVSRCRDLVDRFKQDATPSKSIAPSDAFNMTHAQVDQHLSRKHKRCAHCDSKLVTKIVTVTPGSMDVMLLCARCAEKRQA